MTSEGFYIRHATEADVMLIVDLGARTFKDAYAGPDIRLEDMEEYIASTFTPAKIKAELASPTTIVLLAYKDGETTGYAMLEDNKTPDSIKWSKPIEVVHLYLEQSAIGKGYGATLMKTCIEEARQAGYETIWLGVWEKNDRAIAFYKKWGFREVGSHNFVFGSDVHNDLIMGRSVDLVA